MNEQEMPIIQQNENLRTCFEAKNLLLLELRAGGGGVSISLASEELFWVNNFDICNWEKNLGRKEY